MKNTLIKYSFVLLVLLLVIVFVIKSIGDNDISSDKIFNSTQTSTITVEDDTLYSTDKTTTINYQENLYLTTHQHSSESTDYDFSNEISDKIIVYNTDDNEYVNIKKSDVKTINDMVISYPLIKKLFDNNKEYTITINGYEYYYDSKTGMLGNKGVKILSGEEKEKFDMILGIETETNKIPNYN